MVDENILYWDSWKVKVQNIQQTHFMGVVWKTYVDPFHGLVDAPPTQTLLIIHQMKREMCVRRNMKFNPDNIFISYLSEWFQVNELALHKGQHISGIRLPPTAGLVRDVWKPVFLKASSFATSRTTAFFASMRRDLMCLFWFYEAWTKCGRADVLGVGFIDGEKESWRKMRGCMEERGNNGR